MPLVPQTLPPSCVCTVFCIDKHCTHRVPCNVKHSIWKRQGARAPYKRSIETSAQAEEKVSRKNLDGTYRVLERLWLVILLLIGASVVVGMVIALAVHVEWTREGLSGSGAIRNLMIVVISTVALILAVIRNVAADRVLYATTRSRLNERYARAQTLLGSQHEFARLAGLRSMRDLAAKTDELCLGVSETLDAFVEFPPADEKADATVEEDQRIAREIRGELVHKVQKIEKGKTPWAMAGESMVIVDALAGVVVFLLFLPMLTLFLSFAFWDWLSPGESAVITVSNIFLVFVATMSLTMAIWAGLTAHKQSGITQQRFSDDLYRQNAEMMGHQMLSVRLSAIRSLARIMHDERGYYLDALGLLCAFIRHPPHVQMMSERSMPLGKRVDVSEATQLVFGYWGETREAENIRYRVDLRGADLSGLVLQEVSLGTGLGLTPASVSRANLSGIILKDASLANAHLVLTNMQSSILTGTDMSYTVLALTDFSGSDLTGACLQGADLTSCKFIDVVGLTQAELDKAARAAAPPSLNGSRDRITGKLLVWRDDVARADPPLG